MLRWFVSERDAEKALSGELLDEECIECRPCNVSCAVLDEEAASLTPTLEKYFTKEGWLVVSEVLHIKTRQALWSCPVCNKNASKGSTIACDCCLLWLHKKCCGLAADYNPKSRYWFCSQCCSESVGN